MRLRVPSVDLIVALATIAFCVSWTLAVGKDMSWDQLSYHYYAGLAATSDRLDQDFFPASVQSYLNPYAYLPFFWMVQADLSPMLIGAVLAVLQSLNLILVYIVAKRLIHPQARYATALRFAAVGIAALAPVFLFELGSTFNDILASIPAIGALAALLFSPARPLLLLGGAGALLGVAIALKLTNVILAPALFAGLFFLRDTRARLLTRLMATAAGLVCGFLLVGGWWSYLLHQEFGNPFFPFFNAWFGSPDFLAADIRHYRYLPEHATEILAHPFRMVVPDRDVYTDFFAPDARFAVVLLLVPVVAARRLLRARTSPVPGSHRSNEGHPDPAAFFTACAVAFVLWLLTSGNGRYLMPLVCLAGALAIWMIHKVSQNRLWLICLVSGVFVVQVAGVAIGSEYRWSGLPWNERWFSMEIPDELRTQPGLYLSVSDQPAAFLAPILHPEASFVNLYGQYPLSLQGPGGARLGTLLERHRGRTWILINVEYFDAQGTPYYGAWEVYRSRARSIGLDSDPASCKRIKLTGPYSARIVHLPSGATQLRLDDVPYSMFLACRTTRAPFSTKFAEERARASEIFARLEALCPHAFQPAGGVAVPERIGENGGWHRRYINTDLVVRLKDDHLYVRGYRFNWEPMGTASQLDEPGALDCDGIRVRAQDRDPRLT